MVDLERTMGVRMGCWLLGSVWTAMGLVILASGNTTLGAICIAAAQPWYVGSVR